MEFILRKNVLLFIGLFASFLAYSQEHVDTTEMGQDATASEYVKPQMKSINLDSFNPPSGFEKSENFNGFVHKRSGTIMYLAMFESIDFETLKEGMTADYFSKRGKTLLDSGSTSGDSKRVYYKTQSGSGDKAQISYEVFVKGADDVLWMRITYYKTFEEQLGAEVLKIVRSTNINETQER